MDNNNIYYLIGPVVTFAAGAYFYFKRQKLIKGGIKTEGEVVEMEGKPGSRFPVIKFTTVNGEPVVHKYKVNQGMKFNVGQKVQLFYNPGKPEEFLVDNVSEKWAPLLLIAISFVFLIMFFYYSSVKK
jgi:hypothetical protein